MHQPQPQHPRPLPPPCGAAPACDPAWPGDDPRAARDPQRRDGAPAPGVQAKCA